MRVVLLGAPGSGKGTQAKILENIYGIPHISTGDIFRNNIKNNTSLGNVAKEYIDKGMLVPDEITINIVMDRLGASDCHKGFILDGFPRTLKQAEYLDEAMKNLNIKLDIVLNIFVDDKNIIERISGRRSCEACGASYHTIYNPSKKEGICDICQHNLVIREDDTEDTVQARLMTYHKQTEPLIEYYKSCGIYGMVLGKQQVEDTTKAVLDAMSAVKNDND